MNKTSGQRLQPLVQATLMAARVAMRVVTLVVCLLVAGHAISVQAGEPATPPASAGKGPRIALRSARFVLHTDLPRPDAEQTLERMETALKAAAKYWKCEPRGQIACYVVADLENWPDSSLPHPLARVWVGGVGGATISEFTGAGRETRIRATVYAVPRRGVVEHEVIHAYCYQTFGEAGPDWYKEGMAQLVSQSGESGGAAGCHAGLVYVLEKGTSATVQEVVQAGRFTVQLHDSFGAMLAKRSDRQQHVPLSDWTTQDTELVRSAEQHYVRSWALCHMLLCNPNYATRFRSLGDSFVNQGRDSFDSAFAPVAKEMAFEYAFFLQHIDIGYRVDLCRWDWQKRFRTLDAHGTASARIEAARGYQATGLTVVAGQHYDYATIGSWGTSAESPSTNADGDRHGTGRMVAVVLDAYRLGEPFELGNQGTFQAENDGNLYIRCQDAWNELHDNRGAIQVRLTRPAKTGR
jgi:hypothetical protein